MEIRDNSTNATLYSLNPFTNYTLEIQAHTSAGGGNWSKAITNMTDEGGTNQLLFNELVACIIICFCVILETY